MPVSRLGAFVLFSCFLAFGQQDQSSVPTSSSTPDSANAVTTTDPKAPPVLDLKPDANGALSQEQMQQLFRVAADKDLENEKRIRAYTYVERDVQHNLDGKGETKSTEIKTYEVLEIYGEQVQRLIQKDDKPLDAKEAAKEEEKIQKIIDKHKGETEEDRKKQAEREAKRRDESRKFVSAVADSHDFKLVGTETVGGRDTLVIDAEPRPGYELQDKEERFVSKFRGRLWIDKEDLQLVKVDVEAVDTASVGWVLARIHKGTRMEYEQMRMDDEIWLPRHMTYKLDARVALFKGYNLNGEQTYRDYKKFQTSSRIVAVGEAQEQKEEK